MLTEIEEDSKADPFNTELYLRWHVLTGLCHSTKMHHDDATHYREKKKFIDAIAPQGSGDLEYVITDLVQDCISIRRRGPTPTG